MSSKVKILCAVGLLVFVSTASGKPTFVDSDYDNTTSLVDSITAKAFAEIHAADDYIRRVLEKVHATHAFVLANSKMADDLYAEITCNLPNSDGKDSCETVLMSDLDKLDRKRYPKITWLELVQNITRDNITELSEEIEPLFDELNLRLKSFRSIPKNSTDLETRKQINELTIEITDLCKKIESSTDEMINSSTLEQFTSTVDPIIEALNIEPIIAKIRDDVKAVKKCLEEKKTEASRTSSVKPLTSTALPNTLNPQ